MKSKYIYMKRLLVLLTMCSFALLPSHAVLKEKDLKSTLTILRAELTDYYQELEHQSGFMKAQREKVGRNIFSVLSRSNQNALMLYSQKPDYIFDLTYACHEATEQYREFRKTVLPFNSYVMRNDSEMARYDSLITSLSHIRPSQLDEKSKTDRSVCLALATNIRHTLQDNTDQLQEYIGYYQMAEERLKYLNDYANKRYYDIQTSIFSNEGENYLAILANIDKALKSTSDIVTEKYKPQHKVHSQWDSRMIVGLFLFIAFYAVVAFFINLFLMKVVVRKLLSLGRLKHLESGFKVRQWYIVLATTVLTFALLLGILRISISQNFFIMASNLLVEFAWLLGAILISLLLRIDNRQLSSVFRIYMPLVVMGFVVISFRIILVPNGLVNLIFPPILLICAVWQWRVVRKHRNQVPRSDAAFSYFSLAIFLGSVVCSWMGYTLFSVQLLIWWIMQLTCILTIACLAGWLEKYGENHDMDKRPISETWFYDALRAVVIPIMGVLSVVVSIYWAADIFNLSDTIKNAFTTRFIDTKYIKLSIFAICQVATLYFIFAYLNRTAKAAAALHFEKSDHSTAATRNVMARNIIQVLVWGVWLLISLGIFHINNTWFVVISGGLSTGIGFAMKDILENIYYGISLMAGRIKVGDLIECDGIRGHVSSINYTSTLLDTIDGSVIAFQNSQLFTKNYRNLTKNHGFEQVLLPFGVAYGSNATEVKDLIEKTVRRLKCRDQKKDVRVVFTEFGDNSINFKVLVWVPVNSRIHAISEIMENIYNALNENNIEIPFPQRDVHIVGAQ